MTDPRKADQEIFASENLPGTHLSIALVTKKDKAAFMVKNEPSSRRRALFAQHTCHVLLYEMLTEKLALAKLKGSEE